MISASSEQCRAVVDTCDLSDNSSEGQEAWYDQHEDKDKDKEENVHTYKDKKKTKTLKIVDKHKDKDVHTTYKDIESELLT